MRYIKQLYIMSSLTKRHLGICQKLRLFAIFLCHNRYNYLHINHYFENHGTVSTLPLVQSIDDQSIHRTSTEGPFSFLFY